MDDEFERNGVYENILSWGRHRVWTGRVEGAEDDANERRVIGRRGLVKVDGRGIKARRPGIGIRRSILAASQTEKGV